MSQKGLTIVVVYRIVCLAVGLAAAYSFVRIEETGWAIASIAFASLALFSSRYSYSDD